MESRALEPTDRQLIDRILGYLNFSSGAPDPRFLTSLNELFARLAAEESPWRSVLAVLEDELPRLQLDSSTFSDVSQAQSVLRLMRELLPAFHQASGYEVQVIAVGTGKALRMGREGDVDVVLVHAPGAEKKFVDGGYGVDRKGVMYNDFVIVGPQSDPAGVLASGDATDALRRVAAAKALFVSRGDDSGTHKKERGLWRSAGVVPAGSWYREAGQGMGKVLQKT